MTQYEAKTSFGELFKFSFDVLSKNWLTYLLLSLLMLVPMATFIVMGGAAIMKNRDLMSVVMNDVAMGQSLDLLMPLLGTLFVALGVMVVLNLILTPVVQTANFKVARASAEYQSMTIGNALKSGLSTWGKVFLGSIIMGLLGLIPIALVVIFILVATFVGTSFGVGAGVLAGLIAFLGSVAACVFYSVKVIFVFPILCTEEVGFGEALSKSFEMSGKGKFWDVFLNFLLVNLCMLGVMMGVNFTVGLIPFVGVVFSNIVSVAVVILMNIFLMIFYMDRESLFPEEDPEVAQEIQF